MVEEKTRKHEIDASNVTMFYYGIAEPWIVTVNEEADLEIERGHICAKSAWKWILDYNTAFYAYKSKMGRL
jgi:hypothetical protein